MKPNRIELSSQVAEFLRTLSPEPRKALRQALRDLAQGKGDIVELERPLEDFHRLRVGRYRVVFRYVTAAKGDTIQCVYVGRRELVYELFADLIRGA